MSSEEVANGADHASEPTGGDQLTLTDPKAMRALAHPLRMALLELLDGTPTLTATQASEVLGESPANCAFHLRTLAKYGFVREAGGGKGRERPWTAAHQGLDVSTTGQPDRQSELAAASLTQAWLEWSLERVRRTLVANTWPDGWDDAVSVKESVRFLTPAEAVQVTAELTKVLEPYRGRLHDPASRPAGALPVRINYFALPDPDLSAVSAAQSRSGPPAHSGHSPQVQSEPHPEAPHEISEQEP